MDNFIIIIVVAVIILLAVRSVAGHFQGKGGCCGGGSDYKPRKKKLSKVIDTRVFHVEGMHCEKCANRVTEVVNDIPHVSGTVDLKKGTVTVSYEEPVADELIRSRIQRAGYSLREAE